MKALCIKQQAALTKNYVHLIRQSFSPISNFFFIKKNQVIIKTSRKNIPKILLFLQKHSLCLYQQLIEIAAEDTPKKSMRFRVNYILSSINYSSKVLVSTITNEITYLPSVVGLFQSAGWLEREVWDLFGIYFVGNTELRRILTDYGFSGHPLRKDFPMSGFFEIYYSLERKKIVTEPIELAQEYRVFTL
jgi:NADH:ubiquinone oxidoreductase subunit C